MVWLLLKVICSKLGPDYKQIQETVHWPRLRFTEAFGSAEAEKIFWEAGSVQSWGRSGGCG